MANSRYTLSIRETDEEVSDVDETIDEATDEEVESSKDDKDAEILARLMELIDIIMINR